MKECVASMAGPLPKASLNAKRDAGRSLGELREYFEGQEERVLPSAKIRFTVSPTLQPIVHVKTGWIESRDPSIIRASRRTSSTFRIDFPAATGAELQTQERVILRNQPSFPAPNTH